MKSFAFQNLFKALNRLTDTAPWVRERLAVFSGSTLILDFEERPMAMEIRPLGELGWLPALPEKPDLVIKGTWTTVMKGFIEPRSALHHVHMTGNSALASELGDLARHFRPDLEEILSQYLGDRLAHRLGQWGRRGINWLRDSGERLRDATLEYATEESGLLIHSAHLAHFEEDLERLNRDLQALEKRLSTLEMTR